MKLKKPYFISRSPLTHHKRLLLMSVMFVLFLYIVIFTTRGVLADNLDVTATVPAPLPTSPAVFSSPPNNSRTTSPLITLEGTCPQNGAYVVIYRDNNPIGTAPCQGGLFSITVSLVVGVNQLTAHTFTITDGEGPISAPLTLYYDSPSNSAGKPPLSIPGLPSFAPPPAPSPPKNPFVLWYQYRYQVRSEGEPWDWEIHVSGGTSPYSVIITWGDGKTQTLTVSEETSFSLAHTYTSAGTYTPIVHAKDSTGQEAALQLLAVVDPSPTDETPGSAKREQQADIPISVVIATPLAIVFVAALVKAWFTSNLSPTIKGGGKKKS